MEKEIINLCKAAKEKRTEEDLSLRELAKITGISFATLSRLEKLEHIPDANTQLRLAKWLGNKEFDKIGIPSIPILNAHFRGSKNMHSKTIECLSEVAIKIKIAFQSE